MTNHTKPFFVIAMHAIDAYEARAIELTKTSRFSREAQDNETMHVVVISQIVKRLKCEGFFRHVLIPFLFAFFYSLTIYILYLVSISHYP